MASGQKLNQGHVMNRRPLRPMGLNDVMTQAVCSGAVQPSPRDCRDPKPMTPLQGALNELSGALLESKEQSARLRAALVGVLQPECSGAEGAGQCGQAPSPPTSELVQTILNIAYQIRSEAMLLKNTTDRLDV